MKNGRKDMRCSFPQKEQLLPFAIIEGCDIYLLSNVLLKNTRTESSRRFLVEHVLIKCFHSNVINRITSVCKKLFKLSEKSCLVIHDPNTNAGITILMSEFLLLTKSCLVHASSTSWENRFAQTYLIYTHTD